MKHIAEQFNLPMEIEDRPKPFEADYPDEAGFLAQWFAEGKTLPRKFLSLSFNQITELCKTSGKHSSDGPAGTFSQKPLRFTLKPNGEIVDRILDSLLQEGP